MRKLEFKVRVLNGGEAFGEALVSRDPISFLGDVDPESGEIVNPNNELYGERVGGKILVFPHGRGSTVGSYIIYRLAKLNLAPRAIINLESEEIVIVGCILADIPLVDKPSINPLKHITTGDKVRVDGRCGRVEVYG